MLKTISNIVDKDTMLLVYNALVLSHLSYCDVVWGNCGKCLQNNLQKIQNRAARIINNTPWDSSGNYNLNKLGWDTLEKKRKKNIALMMFDILNKNGPSYLSNKFVFKERPYNTRSGNLCIDTIKPKTESAKRTFLYRGATLWNSLTHEIQGAQSKYKFNNRLKRLDNL